MERHDDYSNLVKGSFDQSNLLAKRSTLNRVETIANLDDIPSGELPSAIAHYFKGDDMDIINNPYDSN